jgi:ribosomal protein S18 acetylase RimI-like enzyme
MIELVWPSAATEDLRAQVHRVLHAVVALGGAVGYLTPPARCQTDEWLDDTLAAVRAGDAALAIGTVGGRVAATGLWRRGPVPIFTHTAEVGKVMAHPESRGLGLGRLVVGGLVERARAAGLELLTLGVRGNNHGSIDLYRSLGFREWGRLPNVVEVGDDRYDDVRMCLELGRAPGVRLRGSAPGGPGSSPGRG